MLPSHEWFPTGGNQPLDQQRNQESNFFPSNCLQAWYMLWLWDQAHLRQIFLETTPTNQFGMVVQRNLVNPSDYFKPTMTSCLHSFETLCYLFPFWGQPNNLPDTIWVKWLKEQALFVSQSLEGKTQSWNSGLKAAIHKFHKTPKQNK